MNVNDICPISNTPSRKICVESIKLDVNDMTMKTQVTIGGPARGRGGGGQLPPKKVFFS
jgi:hypothetical protein